MTDDAIFSSPDRHLHDIETTVATGRGTLTIHEAEVGACKSLFIATMRKVARDIVAEVRDVCLPLWLSLKRDWEAQLGCKVAYPRAKFETGLARPADFLVGGTAWPALPDRLRPEEFKRIPKACVEPVNRIFPKSVPLIEQNDVVGWVLLEKAAATSTSAKDFCCLRDALLDWAKKYHIAPANFQDGDPWFLESTIGNLAKWDSLDNPGYLANLIWTWWPAHPSTQAQQRYMTDLLPKEHLPPQIPAYYPHNQKWEDYEQQAMTILRDYREEREAAHLELGWVPTAMKQKRSLHCEWLVRYQLQGWSINQISKEYSRERSSVRSALREVAALIQLVLRPAKQGGRPRKISK